MEESITEMLLGIPANIKLDSSRFASKQLTRQGEMTHFFFLVSYGVIHSPKTFEMRIHRMKIVFHLKNLPRIYYRWANN